VVVGPGVGSGDRNPTGANPGRVIGATVIPSPIIGPININKHIDINKHSTITY